MGTLLTADTRQRTEGGGPKPAGGGPRASVPRRSIRSRPERLSRVRAKSNDLILFTTQLAIMLDSGVILSDALDAIAEQAADARFKAIILDLSERVKGGEPSPRRLSCYPCIVQLHVHQHGPGLGSFRPDGRDAHRAHGLPELRGRHPQADPQRHDVPVHHGPHGHRGDGHPDVLRPAAVHADLRRPRGSRCRS